MAELEHGGWRRRLELDGLIAHQGRAPHQAQFLGEREVDSSVGVTIAITPAGEHLPRLGQFLPEQCHRRLGEGADRLLPHALGAPAAPDPRDHFLPVRGHAVPVDCSTIGKEHLQELLWLRAGVSTRIAVDSHIAVGIVEDRQHGGPMCQVWLSLRRIVHTHRFPHAVRTALNPGFCGDFPDGGEVGALRQPTFQPRGMRRRRSSRDTPATRRHPRRPASAGIDSSMGQSMTRSKPIWPSKWNIAR